jgi:hypothetical protein
MKTTIRDIIGDNVEEDFLNFDVSFIQETLNEVSNSATPDLAHAEYLCHKCIVAANQLAEYLGRLVKYSSFLENKISSIRNKYALDYKPVDGGKTTADMRNLALKSCADADIYEETLAKLKGTRTSMEKKFDILIKDHHLYKDIASRLNRIIPSENSYTNNSDNWG